jgi:uncharacterized protein (DUF302 family)
MGEISYNIELRLGADEAVERVTEALKSEKFGIISRIDLHSVFKEKLNEDISPHIILGACNPQLAHKAVSNMPEAAMMLPCTVTVQAAGENLSMVRIINPGTVMKAAGLDENPAVKEVGQEAGRRLKRVADALKKD